MCNNTASDEIGTQKEIFVSPNPFTTKINLSTTSVDEQYMLVDILGKIIYEGKAIDNQDFSYLPKGVYVLKIAQKSNIFNLKVIKK